ncbi:MAG: D-alanyl-D-alanine carboxypeptidase family protein [Ruminococcaceae bacterium]|nr:D-alanyl-D-alanine carboxypeptidase family protein [Oscillospiraceae bacterium]
MGNRSTPSRSFNTLKHSNRDQRIKRNRQARLSLLAMIFVAIAIALTLSIFLICSLVDHFSTVTPPNLDDTGSGSGEENNGEILYEQITKTKDDVHTGILLIVNEEYEYVFPTDQSYLIKIAENRTKVDGKNPYQLNTTYAKEMHREAFAYMDKMLLDYFRISEGDGAVMVKYAYRSYQDQEALNSTIGAGFSDHHTGCCIALHQADTSNFPPIESTHWIYENAYQYGFVMRYPVGKEDKTLVSDYEHCFRYVGIPHAAYINANDLCLEEYVDLLKNQYAGDQHLKIQDKDGNDYEVYYVAAGADELTTIKVPKNYAYTISGDNIGGFIVTVCLDTPNA